jgi:adenylate cyclase
MVDQLKRKLAAILHADVVGFSRLSGEDEEGTYLKLRHHLNSFAEAIRSHRGRIVNTAGDAVLAEFPTASDALNCAMAVQRAFRANDQGHAETERLQFRIGVNLGEVIVDNDNIYGDGVNVASRLEGLAEPGGICVSQAVHAAVGRKLDLAYQDMGRQRVKNIAEPVHAYQVLLDREHARPSPQDKPRRGAVLAIGGLALCLVLATAVWLGLEQYSRSTGPEDAAVAANAALPSIAVLPFLNLGGDAKQDYFSDGITNDIITDLSRFSNLFVIASNSVFTYKGKAVDIKEVGRDLGVRYVLEGSIQMAGDSMRLNAQLIDTSTNHHLWADRYDRELTDIFAVQDELTMAIVAALQVVLTEVEQARGARQYTKNLRAYDLFLRGRSYLRGSRQTHRKARKLFDQAIALDPNFAAAYAEKSLTYFSGFIMPMSRDPKVIEASLEAAERAVALDPNSPLAQARLGWALFANRRHEEAVAAGRRAVALGPSNAEAHAQLGNILNWSGDPEAAITHLERAMRLNPHHPFYYLFYLGHSHYLLKNREQAIELMERVVTRAPYFLPVRRHLAVLYEEVGRTADAKAQTKELLRIFPGASIEDERARCFYRWTPPLMERFFSGLRGSGMPEGEPGEEPMEM